MLQQIKGCVKLDNDLKTLRKQKVRYIYTYIYNKV